MTWPLQGIGLYDRLTGLILKQVNCVRRVVPEQMIRPRARLPKSVEVRATEEKCLYLQLLNAQLAAGDALMDPLMGGIEPPRVPDHAHQPGLLLQRGHRPGVHPVVGERYLHLHMLAGAQALERLRRVQLRRSTKNCRFDARLRQRLAEFGGDMRNAVFRGDGARCLGLAPDQGNDLDAANLSNGIEMFLAESAGACQGDFQGSSSRIRWPSAVLDTGT